MIITSAQRLLEGAKDVQGNLPRPAYENQTQFLTKGIHPPPHVGSTWSMETHLRTELILQALDMAITQRKPSGVIPINHERVHGRSEDGRKSFFPLRRQTALLA